MHFPHIISPRTRTALCVLLGLCTFVATSPAFALFTVCVCPEGGIEIELNCNTGICCDDSALDTQRPSELVAEDVSPDPCIDFRLASESVHSARMLPRDDAASPMAPGGAVASQDSAQIVHSVPIATNKRLPLCPAIVTAFPTVILQV